MEQEEGNTSKTPGKRSQKLKQGGSPDMARRSGGAIVVAPRGSGAMPLARRSGVGAATLTVATCAHTEISAQRRTATCESGPESGCLKQQARQAALSRAFCLASLRLATPHLKQTSAVAQAKARANGVGGARSGRLVRRTRAAARVDRPPLRGCRGRGGS